MQSTVYDFETLSQDVFRCVVINMAILNFDETRFLKDPYEFEELVESCNLIKFNVEEQVEVYNRKIEKRTLDWWSQQSPEARKQMVPKKDDVSIKELPNWLNEQGIQNSDFVYTRGNTFDPVILDSIFKHFNLDVPYSFWKIRDFRSFFDGLTHGHNINNSFIPKDIKDKIIKHNPAHDISLDVMRFQFLIRTIND